MLTDLFKDSPAYEWMTEQARKEEREKTRLEEQEKARQLVLEEREKTRLEEQEKARQGLLAHDRETVVALVTQRFPNLSYMAQKQVQGVEDIERLQKLMLQINAAHESMEVANLLVYLDVPEQ